MSYSEADPSSSPQDQNLVLRSDEKLLDELQKIVLVAEDNKVNQKIMILLLEQLGLKADVVENGKEAIEAVTRRDYPVVLMDCHMPEMDGFEATRRIREMELASGRHTPIIAVTALAMVGDRERCIAAGMDDYISKPIDRERLKSKLNQWMQREFVFHNQKLAERYFTTAPSAASYVSDPIDLAELEVFYGTEELEEVLQLFVQMGNRQLEDLQSGIGEHHVSLVQRVAHELKGASASIGARELSLVCLQLEQLAGQQKWREAAHQLNSIRQLFGTVERFIKAHFEQTAMKRQ